MKLRAFLRRPHAQPAQSKMRYNLRSSDPEQQCWVRILDGPPVLCIVASVPRPQAICTKKRVPRWVIPLISASGNGAGAGDERRGEVPPRGQLHNVLALGTKVREGDPKEVKPLHSYPLGGDD